MVPRTCKCLLNHLSINKAFYTSAVFSTLQSFAANKMNTKSKKEFAAKLRKTRWTIYQQIQLKQRRVKRTFDAYKKQVNMFLKDCSGKLKPKDNSIWIEKLGRTSADVFAFLGNARNVFQPNVVRAPQSCFECSNKLDSVLLMLSTVLHLIKNDHAGVAKPSPMTVLVMKDIAEATLKEEVANITVDAASQTVDEFDASTEDSDKKDVHTTSKPFDTGDVTVDAKKPTEVLDKNVAFSGVAKGLHDDRSGESTSTPVENDVNEFGIKVTWRRCPQLRHFPPSECRRRCQWDVEARRKYEPAYLQILKKN